MLYYRNENYEVFGFEEDCLGKGIIPEYLIPVTEEEVEEIQKRPPSLLKQIENLKLEYDDNRSTLLDEFTELRTQALLKGRNDFVEIITQEYAEDLSDLEEEFRTELTRLEGEANDN